MTAPLSTVQLALAPLVEPPGAAATAVWVLPLLAAALLVLLVIFYQLRRLRARARRLATRVHRLETDLLRIRQRMYSIEAARALSERGQSPRMPVEFTSQYGEDLFLWDLFRGKRDGVFIEVGAYDGYHYSVTYPFEAVGWTGVLIEAIPDRYASCVERRPGSLVAHAALTRHSGADAQPDRTATFTIIEGDAPEEMLSFLQPSDAHRKLLARSGGKQRTVTVPLSTMDDILAAAAKPSVPGGGPSIANRVIDFAVIDVEGSEIDVLDGFDLETHRVRVLLVEDMTPRNAASPSAYLARRHYTHVGRIGVSGVFIRSDEPELIERARAVAVGRA